tara:strand:+ start:6345 stop:6593 length:249 start_codon:yes stop_codon:yes gene_type:complete
MEPMIIDAYNEYPYGINVIDELNKELEKIQLENDELKEIIIGFKKVIEEYKKKRDLENIFEELRKNEEIRRRKERKNKYGCF